MDLLTPIKWTLYALWCMFVVGIISIGLIYALLVLVS